jgi:hypothetical protein
LTARVNGGLANGLLNIEDFHSQQTMGVNLRGIRRHRRDNPAFGLDVLFALKTDDVRKDLSRLQLGDEVDAPVSGAERGSQKEQEAGSPL